MGSATETVEEAVDLARRAGRARRRRSRSGSTGPSRRPTSLRALPATTRAIAVLDRTKEPGAIGEPLYLDVVAALHEARAEGPSHLAQDPVVIGGRYGLSSKEFTPAMACAVFDETGRPAPQPPLHDRHRRRRQPLVARLGPRSRSRARRRLAQRVLRTRSDGTVGANKNSIKIIGEETDAFAQGYFVYDSKKSGAVTISHLRFGPRPIRSPYLIKQASFVGCHQFLFLDRYDVLAYAAPGAVAADQQPLRRRRGLGRSCRGRCRTASSRRASRCT